MQRRLHSEAGVAAVEFALVLPLLLIILFGAVEFGLAFNRQQIMTYASEEGARAGIILATPRPTAGDITNVVTNYLAAVGLDTSQASITVTGAGGASGSDLTVRVQYPTSLTVLSALIPGIPAILTLSGVAVMRLE